ncbi:MAG TPA: 4-alpha-glucanotransferase, partial [Kofleriaceae bacterium]|nr:4-alpha-glucanotransferase [Kofleriaceae bacterium]
MTPDELRAGLAKLGVKRMLFAIHDVSFPSDPDEDIGRGSPATKAAQRLFGYVKELGFTGVQLGPQGQTSRSNPSPYDSTIFSRSVGNIALGSFHRGGAFEGLVSPVDLEAVLVEPPRGHARHRHAYDTSWQLITVAYNALMSGMRPDLKTQLRDFMKAQSWWLVPDAVHAALATKLYRGAGFREWPETERELWAREDTALLEVLERIHWRFVERYSLGQLFAHMEHERLRRICKLQLYGDMQVGYSDADAWHYSNVFLPGYRMGAPPSRTNPDGQPWGYPALHPSLLTLKAGALVVARAEKAF